MKCPKTGEKVNKDYCESFCSISEEGKLSFRSKISGELIFVDCEPGCMYLKTCKAYNKRIGMFTKIRDKVEEGIDIIEEVIH